jgi:adenosyl cobinamide kinase/adenosyl cobinamide phosphate guanylyltransferase
MKWRPGQAVDDDADGRVERHQEAGQKRWLGC